MRARWKASWVLPIVFLLTGCWDSHNVEKVNYIAALGIDYEKPNYVIYGQMLDFGSVAKQEAAQNREQANIWLGRGEGETMNIAMNALYNTAQQRIIWSHVTTILIGERALKQGVDSFLDATVRFREIRFTPWVFGTKLAVKDILTTPAFFNLSPLETISHAPVENYRQRSWIVPLNYMTFLADYQEPAKTVILPSLSIDPAQWTKLKQPSPKLAWDGAYVLSKKKTKGKLNLEDLEGLRWLEEKTVRTPLVVKDGDKTIGVVSLEKPKPVIRVLSASGHPRYELTVSLHGNIVELLRQTKEADFLAKAEQTVREEIRSTFEKGLSMNTDLLQLEYALYLARYKDWVKLSDEGALGLDKDSLERINVHILIEHSGMLKQ
ncbi:Ger(x)C family spore germination protein [Paenibacillus doosanensis]|uniref:Ger(x)C family spore germination protein n=1 Tax=Paenibacillus doosanensis TaxID=1229154 RepID=UPI00217F776D|nr:Ger(x)C family spore germination protein [Paenibacillus doosanensis]MCS7461267.1 Ger(x)C family spore germination protein [Paenibacillus doosanensis]